MDAIETSKTHKLYLLLKERIVSGAFAPGHRLPSEPRLAEAHQMSRVTIRRALDGLARDGLIVRQPGSGTFVRWDQSSKVMSGDLTNMVSQLKAMGKATRVRLLGFGYIQPPPAVAAALKLAEGERVQHALRVRYLDEQPFSYLTTYVPERIGSRYAEADLAKRPLLELLEQSGVMLERADQTISATLAGPDAAQALGVEIGAPLLSMTRVVFGEDGRGVEYLSALYRPDRRQFHMELRRAGEGANRHWRTVDSNPAQSAGRRPAGKGRRRP